MGSTKHPAEGVAVADGVEGVVIAPQLVLPQEADPVGDDRTDIIADGEKKKVGKVLACLVATSRAS
jgi:hypothetical protein